MDAFLNSASCEISINVIDDLPPAIENCNNQTIILDAICAADANQNLPECQIVFDEPLISDNTKQFLVTTNLITPNNETNKRQAIITTTDSSQNTNVCVINITVQYKECSFMTAPKNGEIVCMRNRFDSVCLMFCRAGHAIYDTTTHLTEQNITLVCEHKYAKWRFDEIPECLPLTIPNVMKDVLDVQLHSTDIGCNKAEELHAVSLYPIDLFASLFNKTILHIF